MSDKIERIGAQLRAQILAERAGERPVEGGEMAAFDRAEFDELLREVVALREWKAAHEAAAFKAPVEGGPSAAAIEAAYAVSERRLDETRTESLVRALRAAYAVDFGSLAPAPSGPTDEQEIVMFTVLWGGGNDDGCAFCGGDYIGDTPHVAHEDGCPIPPVRLRVIARLMEGDPSPESKDGKRLKALAEAQEAHSMPGLRYRGKGRR